MRSICMRTYVICAKNGNGYSAVVGTGRIEWEKYREKAGNVTEYKRREKVLECCYNRFEREWFKKTGKVWLKIEKYWGFNVESVMLHITHDSYKSVQCLSGCDLFIQ